MSQIVIFFSNIVVKSTRRGFHRKRDSFPCWGKSETKVAESSPEVSPSLSFTLSTGTVLPSIIIWISCDLRLNSAHLDARLASPLERVPLRGFVTISLLQDVLNDLNLGKIQRFDIFCFVFYHTWWFLKTMIWVCFLTTLNNYSCYFLTIIRPISWNN